MEGTNAELRAALAEAVIALKLAMERIRLDKHQADWRALEAVTKIDDALAVAGCRMSGDRETTKVTD